MYYMNDLVTISHAGPKFDARYIGTIKDKDGVEYHLVVDQNGRQWEVHNRDISPKR